MKRTKLMKHLTAGGCVVAREGGSHTIWKNLRTGKIDVVPRHREIAPHLARSICKTLEVEPPREN